jgi:hypothetical protein
MSGKAVSSVLPSVTRISTLDRPSVGRVSKSVALRSRYVKLLRDENALELISLMGLLDRSLHECEIISDISYRQIHLFNNDL